MKITKSVRTTIKVHPYNFNACASGCKFNLFTSDYYSHYCNYYNTFLRRNIPCKKGNIKMNLTKRYYKCIKTFGVGKGDI